MSSTNKPTSKRKAAPVFNPLSTKEAKEVKAKRTGKKSGGPKTDGEKGKPRKSQAESPPGLVMPDFAGLELPFECYFFAKGEKYLMRDDAGNFQPHGLETFRRNLRLKGISGKSVEGSIVSPHDHLTNLVQSKFGVDAAMRLAGYKAGFRVMNGTRLLVTVSPNLPTPKAGRCETITRCLSELMGVGVDVYGEKQFTVLRLWLVRGWQSIADDRTLPGQCLILAGPAAAAKTMIQERIITAILGGRKAKAALVVVKDKDFTKDLAESEHLYLADELVSSDYRTRMNLAEKIKSFVANRGQSVHPKGLDQMTLDPRWRLSLSLNDQPDRLAMLPPLDDADIADKVHLLHCHPVTRPTDDAEQEAWIDRMIAEIPAFLHDALKLDVPDDLREMTGVRFGHRAFHHPELMAEMSANEGEATALAIIDRLLMWSSDHEPVTDSASNLRLLLLDKASGDTQMGRELERLVPTTGRMASVLTRLMSRYPERVQGGSKSEVVNRKGDKRLWCIFPPKQEDEPEADT